MPKHSAYQLHGMVDEFVREAESHRFNINSVGQITADNPRSPLFGQIVQSRVGDYLIVYDGDQGTEFVTERLHHIAEQLGF